MIRARVGAKVRVVVVAAAVGVVNAVAGSHV